MGISGLTKTQSETSVVNISNPTPDTVTIDGRDSTDRGVATGGQIGVHSYQISTIRNNLDVTAGSTEVPTIAGVAVDEISPGVWQKNIAGNAWDSWFQSADPIGSVNNDFAVSWLIEESAGTIREMGGLDNQPNSNASFTSIEFAVYQVNDTTIQFYESGGLQQTLSQGISIGDRFGVKIERGVASSFILQGGIETVLRVSPRAASGDLFFKGALNRGVGSSGHSVMGQVHVHDTLHPGPVVANIIGGAKEAISELDANTLLDVGLVVLPGSTYSLINAEVQDTLAFPAGIARDLMHSYCVATSQTSVSF